MKRIVFILLAFIALLHVLMFIGCSTEKRLQKIRKNNPDLFKSDTVIKTSYLFKLDTLRVQSSADNFVLDTDSLVNTLLLALDSCSQKDKRKIATIPKHVGIKYKERFVKDCPEAFTKDTLNFTTKEGHKIILTPTAKGYDINVVTNCPTCPGDKWYEWWQLFVLGFATGVLVIVLTKKY